MIADSVKLTDAEYLVQQKQKAKRMLLWITIAGMIMMFAGLTSAYVVRQAEGNWTNFELPVQFMISTLVIMASSGSMFLATSAIRKNQLGLFRSMMFITLGLGLLFTLLQFLGWSEMVRLKLFFVANDPSTSFVYAITGLHLLHLAGGLLALVVVSIKSISDQYSSNNYLGVSLCGIYWHFLDALWVYLYLFFLFFR